MNAECPIATATSLSLIVSQLSQPYHRMCLSIKNDPFELRSLYCIRQALPVSISKNAKMTMKTNTKHIASKAKPKAQLVEMNAYQQAVCVSWWLSNSSIKICSASKARIVDKPSSVTVKCVNIGDRSGEVVWIDINYKLEKWKRIEWLLTGALKSLEAFRRSQINATNEPKYNGDYRQRD